MRNLFVNLFKFSIGLVFTNHLNLWYRLSPYLSKFSKLVHTPCLLGPSRRINRARSGFARLDVVVLWGNQSDICFVSQDPSHLDTIDAAITPLAQVPTTCCGIDSGVELGSTPHWF